jgi:predicted ABC-type ATPase
VREIFIVAGPNGAGKTSFANEYLRTGREHIVFVNVDEIARRLEEPPLGNLHRDMRAGRVMLEQIEGLVSTGTSFMFETTLTSLAYAQKIPVWRQLGYRTALTYLRLERRDVAAEGTEKSGRGRPRNSRGDHSPQIR